VDLLANKTDELANILFQIGIPKDDNCASAIEKLLHLNFPQSKLQSPFFLFVC
jgi:hypothetical protein